jgi:hypothetical protein
MNSIKKGIVYSAVALVCVLFTLGYGHLDSYADINGNESRLIGVASSTFYYQGAYYRVEQAYINQLINMLDSSYDLTAAQADACIDYIYNNVASGIASGYLYKVEDEKKEDAVDDPKGNDDKVPEDDKKPQDKAPDKDIGADKKIVDVGKDAKADKTKEEMAKEAAELAKELGMNISFDSDDNDFSIVDDSGNVVVSTKAAVKNTGFRLNSLVYTGIAILAVFAVSVAVAVKFGLFKKDDE